MVSLLSLVVALSAAAIGLAHPSSTTSLLNEIVRMMGNPVEDVGSCGNRCCVEIENRDGTTQSRLLDLAETVISESDPCTVYTCTDEGLRNDPLKCVTAPCESGTTAPVLFPGECCPRCVGGSREEGRCDFTEWTDYGPCSVTCGVGQRARTRSVKSIADQVDFLNCTGFLSEVKTCDVGPCIEHCEWHTVETGECVPNCGGGEKRRHYIITQLPANGGEDCPPKVYANKTEIIDCCDNCEWEYQFGECSRQCGGGERTKFPVITKPAKEGGFCPSNVLSNQTETVGCNNDPCPCEFETCDLNGMRRCIDPSNDPDKDCVETNNDNCRLVYNPDQGDMDNDGIGDACDKCNLTGPGGIVDRDNDGVDDICDNCPQTPNENQNNIDGDDTGDSCDPDDDNDGTIDTRDNCPTVPNANQRDSNRNGVGDACESRAQNAYDSGAEGESDKLTSEEEKDLLLKIMEKMMQLYYTK